MENAENHVVNQEQPRAELNDNLEPVFDSDTKEEVMKVCNSLLIDIDKNFEELAIVVQSFEDTQKRVGRELTAYKNAHSLMDVHSEEYQKYLQLQEDESFISRIVDMIRDRVSEKVTEEQYDQFLQLIETRPHISQNQEVRDPLEIAPVREMETSTEMELPDVGSDREIGEINNDSLANASAQVSTETTSVAQSDELGGFVTGFPEEDVAPEQNYGGEQQEVEKDEIISEGNFYVAPDGCVWESEEEYQKFMQPEELFDNSGKKI